ncbi:hypothetical protein BDV59DRAFT_68106 [Aspergillus ambiguus]|uniref:uncharacterized protein n=1 Tax=Aspergillus ambiguus TaxID=176160 RepID=UPI003CCDC376
MSKRFGFLEALGFPIVFFISAIYSALHNLFQFLYQPHSQLTISTVNEMGLSECFAHATESPFDTTIGWEHDPDAGIYTAKQIGDFILSVKGADVNKLKPIIAKHGLFEDWPVRPDIIDPDEIHSFGCVLAIAHLYDKVADDEVLEADIIKAYAKCVRAVNALTYLLQVPHDRASRLPAPARLDRGERWKLDRTWDICVCLLGATKARCGFVRKFHVGDLPIVQNIHYRRATEKALDWNWQEGKGHICRKALTLLTRQEIAPFIQPCHLIKKLQYNQDIPHHFNHKNCTESKCDFDWKREPGDDERGNRYHVPGCHRDCGLSTPPQASMPDFTRIALEGMPAVKFDRSRNNVASGWVKADNNTLVVSHVWRDGVWGTRDQGLNGCVHNLLANIAIERGCNSYWIDCATIPNEERVRRSMIERINWTFLNAGSVLCWDNTFAKLDSNDPGRLLLSLIVSPWHRRAWTLLEGNRAQLDHMNFLRWSQGGALGSYELFPLGAKVKSALGDSTVPLWIRSALVELLPYSGATMSMDAAGYLLSGRHATRVGDAETIWGLLRPVESMNRVGDLRFDNPYLYSNDEVDVAFISSNAKRFKPDHGTPCWRPGMTNASVWVRTAYGGIKARIQRKQERQLLVGNWWVKQGEDLEEHINWDTPVDAVEKELLSRLRSDIGSDKIALICPILMGDPKARIKERKAHSEDPVKGFFRTNMCMECSRAILITQHTQTDPWQWQTIVKLNQSLIFTTSEQKELVIGSRPS